MMKDHWKEYGIAALLLLIVCAFLFYKPLSGSYEFVTADSLSPKAIAQGISKSESQTGEYPLWLPWVFSGLPSIHSFQNISHYYLPNHLFTLLRDLGMPWFWTYLFHYIFAGLGVYVLLRELKVSKTAAIFGGMSFMMTPYLITMIVHGHGSQMMTAAFIPWVIWSLVRLKNSPGFFHMGLLALLAGLQLQRSHVQIAYYTWMMIGLYILIQLICMIRRKSWQNWPFFAYLTGGLLLAVGLALIIYWPVSSYTPYSIRGGTGGGTGFEYATGWSFSFGEMMTFLLPSFYGFGGVTYWGNMPFTDYPNYMGIIVLLLAILGAFSARGSLRWLLIVTAFSALLLSFGKHLFLYQLFYDHFPYFSKFRVPVMFLVLTQFSVAVLAGFGFQRLRQLIQQEHWKRRMPLIFYVAGGVGLLLLVMAAGLAGIFDIPRHQYPVVDALRRSMVAADLRMLGLLILLVSGVLYAISKSWIKPALGWILIILFSVVDLGWVDQKIIEPSEKSLRAGTMQKASDARSFTREDDIIRFLKKDTDVFRILPLGRLMNDNRWAAFQLENVMGYHPAKLQSYNELINQTGLATEGILQMLNVKYVLSLEPVGHPSLVQVHSGNLYFQGQYVNCLVYEYQRFTPRVFFVDRIETISELAEGQAILNQVSFDPMTDSFTDSNLTATEFQTGESTVALTRMTPNEIRVTARCDGPQFLVYSEIYYPEGWHAETSDGTPVVIHQVNTVLRGLELPAGTNQIILRFQPADLRYGSLVSWSSLLIILGLLAVPLIREK